MGGGGVEKEGSGSISLRTLSAESQWLGRVVGGGAWGRRRVVEAFPSEPCPAELSSLGGGGGGRGEDALPSEPCPAGSQWRGMGVGGDRLTDF